jgi:hypothetical protein
VTRCGISRPICGAWPPRRSSYTAPQARLPCLGCSFLPVWRRLAGRGRRITGCPVSSP